MCLHAQPVGNAGGNSYLHLVDDNIEKESDNLTKSSERYNADEQADFTQTEAEEWATEIAIRLAEGNLDPIPKNKDKQIEQYDFRSEERRVGKECRSRTDAWRGNST